MHHLVLPPIIPNQRKHGFLPTDRCRVITIAPVTRDGAILRVRWIPPRQAPVYHPERARAQDEVPGHEVTVCEDQGRVGSEAFAGEAGLVLGVEEGVEPFDEVLPGYEGPGAVGREPDTVAESAVDWAWRCGWPVPEGLLVLLPGTSSFQRCGLATFLVGLLCPVGG